MKIWLRMKELIETLGFENELEIVDVCLSTMNLTYLK